MSYLAGYDDELKSRRRPQRRDDQEPVDPDTLSLFDVPATGGHSFRPFARRRMDQPLMLQGWRR